MRRRPAEPGHRPRAGVRFAMGWCAAPRCPETFIVDRAETPWARARTCSEACRAALGNRGRNSTNCRHCELVDSYRELRESEIRRYEVAAADEDLRPVTWGAFLSGYRAPQPPPDDDPTGVEVWTEADEAWAQAWADECVA